MATSLLLADDSPTIAKILGMALQSEDYDIRSALTAEEAEKELRSNPPFFFLVDLTLPGKNGYEFARLIRADRKLKEVRILLLASAFDPADENEVKACGADGVITKPFDPGELRRRLREVRDAPRSFGIPEVTGSLAGAPVRPSFQAPQPDSPPAAPSPAALSTVPAEPETDLNALLGTEESDPLSILAGSSDADSILGSALNADLPPPAPEETPVFDLTAEEGDFTNSTVMIEASGLDAIENTPSQPVVDLSNSFATPPRGTALLEMSRLDQPPAAPKAPPPQPSAAPKTPAACEPPLSANAQALAAFFAAEIDANGAPPPAPATAQPAEAEEDAFDASLSSIEWGSSKDNLNEWSSAPPAKAPAAAPARELTRETRAPKREATHEISGFSDFAAPEMAPERPTPAPRAENPRPASKPASPPSGASSEGGSFLFDTGGSNFRFADDYVQRITKSFTGNTDEMTLGKDASAPVFQKASDDRPSFAPDQSADPLEAKAKHLPTGGGAWSPEEVKRIEQIVRDEVQMVVREIAEKVVWEVVPELAENLIRKELDKVLKEMEE